MHSHTIPKITVSSLITLNYARPGERLAVLSLRRFRIGAVWRARSERATWTSQRRAKITNKTLGAQEAGSRQPNGRHAHRRK